MNYFKREKTVAILDYGTGNFFSLVHAIKRLGHRPIVTASSKILSQSDVIILPGVGSFGAAICGIDNSHLHQALMTEALRQKRIIGICLGMQILFERSEESPDVSGFGFIKGEVKMNMTTQTGSPLNIGWKKVEFNPIFSEFSGNYFYFMHSFSCFPVEDDVVSARSILCEDLDVCAMVISENIIGCQFHPEKSGETGLLFLRELLEHDENL